MLSNHMTFPDDETLLNAFGGPLPVPNKPWKGFGKVNARPAEIYLGKDRSKGLFVHISGRELDHFYRRFLDIASGHTPQLRQDNRTVALVHATQGLSWAPAKDFDQLAGKHGGECRFVAITDNILNFEYDPPNKTAFLGAILGHEGNFGCVLPHSNDVIVAVMHDADSHLKLSAIANFASRAKVFSHEHGIKLATVEDKVLRPCYALHLPHVQIYNLFWVVDADAFDSMSPPSDSGTDDRSAIVWEEHEKMEEQDGHVRLSDGQQD